MKRKIVSVFLFGLFLAGMARAQQKGKNEIYDFSTLDHQIQTWVDSGFYQGASILVAKNNQVIHRKYYGSYDAGSVAYIASAGKWLAAATIAAVVAEGKLSWEDKVKKWIPEIKDVKGEATLRQLLSHTAGYPDYQPEGRPVDHYQRLAESVLHLQDLPADTLPGTKFKYGGLAMQVAGRMAELATGKDWEQIFQEKIAHPLEMIATHFTPVDTTPGHSPMLGGGARTCLQDYANFLNMISNDGVFKGKRILPKSVIREMQADQIGTAKISPLEYVEKARGSSRKDIYGLGEWREEVAADGKAILLSSPSWAGAYPWIDKKNNVYGFFLVRVAHQKNGFSVFYASPILPFLVREILNERAQLVTYDAPKGLLMNTDFTIKVREKGKAWQAVPAYAAKIANVVDAKTNTLNTSFCYFDFSGEVEVSVTYNKGTIAQAKIRPLSYGVSPKVTGKTIVFSLTDPRNLSIEVNGDIFHNLQLFANPIETFRPVKADTNILYYGPGIHWAGLVKVPSNKTVYIAGGAVVHGQFLVSHVEHVKIKGRGILTQLTDLITTPKKSNPNQPQKGSRGRNDELTVEFSKDVEIDGIVVMPHKYSVLVGQSNEVTIKNLKSFSSEGNADGIDIFCSSNVLVDRVFMRNSDDCIAIYGHRWNYYGDTRNITIQNSTLWADVAHPILIGTHGDTKNPNVLENMKFTNIDILDQHENQIDYQGCLALNAGDSNEIRNIRFENIRIEDIRKGQLINMRVMFNDKYNTSAGKGIENIYFKDLSYQGNKANLSIISGYDERNKIKNVTFENLRVNGKVIADDMPGKPEFYRTGDMANILVGEHVDEIKFIQQGK